MLQPDEWMRDGRGRSWTFQLPTVQVIRVLEEAAADMGDDLELLACSTIKLGNRWFSYTAVNVPPT